MKLTTEDQQLLEDLCIQNGVDVDKVLRLLKTVSDFEFKDRRTGIYDALRDILKTQSSRSPIRTDDD